MQSWSSKDFTADRAWGALDIANFSGTTVRLHWTDQPYIWHINDGQEVFAVMDGQVAMHVKVDGEEQIIMLNAGDIFYAGVGCEHSGGDACESRRRGADHHAKRRRYLLRRGGMRACRSPAGGGAYSGD
ncbi:mannose-6-phosphate isomerase [Klebsiella pneumoniae]|nr:mannose-6-phosphate isomerase [Klebsiella pneumoniae]